MSEKENTINLKKCKKTWVETPTIFQMEATECGAASLGMILSYHGHDVALEQLRIDCGISRNGSTASSIIAAGQLYGLECHGYRRSIKNLLTTKCPCIIHWQFMHFVVFEGVKKGKVYINDPASGRRELTFKELDESYTGIVITFDKTDKFVKNKRKSPIFSLIKERISGEKNAVRSLVIMGLIIAVPGIIIPIISKVFIDDILLANNPDWTFKLLIFMGATILFKIVFSWLKSSTLNFLSTKIALISGNKFTRHMLRLPINFYEQRFAGDLVDRIENNTKVNDFVYNELSRTILNIFIAMFYFVILVFYSPFLTLIGVFGVIINLFVNFKVSKSLGARNMKLAKDNGRFIGVLYSGVKMSDSLKAAGAENKFVSRSLGYQVVNIENQQEIAKITQILTSIPTAITKVFNIFILMVGGKLVIDGEMTVGDLTAFTSLMEAFSTPVNSLATFSTKLQSLKADISRVQDIENYSEAIQFTKTDYIPLEEKLYGNVELRNICFGYSKLEKPILDNFNLELKSGRSVALVGATGSGKSTVGKLIGGLFDAWSGDVLFDDKPLREIDPLYFSSSVATVSQEISIFSGTIKDNITLWNKHIKDEDIIKAAKDACIHDDIIATDHDYDELLDEGGTNISGGQRQRIEIARALVNNPTVLILDEATSALDPITEQTVMQNIKRRGCASIIVAHRLSTIRDCDEIIVLDHGSIVERGSHSELIAKKGSYYELVRTM